MATLAIDPPSLFDDPRGAPASGQENGQGLTAPFAERTLEDMLVSVWEDVAAARPAACPVCAGALTPRHGAGARPIGASCGGCGSRLG